MQNFYLSAIICLTISTVSGSGEDNFRGLASEVVAIVEAHREECSFLPERSVLENHLQKCFLETSEKGDQIANSNPDYSGNKVRCEMLTSFLECSSSLINEMVSCGKNPELVTLIALAKGSCEYENQNQKRLNGLKDLFEPCYKDTEAMNEFRQCAKEEVGEDLSVLDDSLRGRNPDNFCSSYSLIKRCAEPALEKNCPELLVELTSIYESSRSNSPDPSAFDTCLATPISSSS